MTDPAATDTTARNAPSSALYRSRIEIHRILQSIARDGGTVSAEVGDSKLFVTRLLHVDDASEHLAFAFGTDKSTNRLVLNQRSLEFVVNHHGAHITFAVSGPSQTMCNGEPAIRYPFPHALVLNQRRGQPRIRIPPDVSLRCLVDDPGGMPFEVRIVDISLDGMGTMLYDRGIALAAGMILKGCRIMIPGGHLIVADLEVRNAIAVTLPDGTPASRAGVRFVKKPEGIEALIDMFVLDLDQGTP